MVTTRDYKSYVGVNKFMWLMIFTHVENIKTYVTDDKVSTA